MTAEEGSRLISPVCLQDTVKSLLLERLDLLESAKLSPSAKFFARETLLRYTTLASELGLKAIKDRLEDAAFEILHPEERCRIIEKVHFLTDLPGQNTLLEIRDNLEKTLVCNGLTPMQILARLKSPFSIWQKLKRKSLELEQLRDILGFRVIVNSIPECYLTISILHDIFSSDCTGFKDYIRFPKDQAYQSLHTTIVGPYQKRIEVQVRTVEMDVFTKSIYTEYWKQKTSFV